MDLSGFSAHIIMAGDTWCDDSECIEANNVSTNILIWHLKLKR